MEMQMALPRFHELPSEKRAAQRARLLAAVRAPRRRRGAIVAIAVGVAVLAAAPTLAFQRELVDFWSAEPAPERIQLDFDELREHIADANARFGTPKFTPVGPAREVMRVHIDGETRSLWVARTEEGTFCFRLHFGLSCLTPQNAQHAGVIGLSGLATKHGAGFNWLAGSVRENAVQEVELHYQDGERVKIPFVWVSPPVDVGFFAYDVPPEHEEPGRLTAAVVGLDEDGKMVAGQCLRLPPDEPAATPEAEALCKRP
jgi:hypothetical protein